MTEGEARSLENLSGRQIWDEAEVFGRWGQLAQRHEHRATDDQVGAGDGLSIQLFSQEHGGEDDSEYGAELFLRERPWRPGRAVAEDNLAGED